MRKYLAYNMPIELQTIKKTFFADSKKTIATNKNNFMNDYICTYKCIYNTSKYRNSNGKNIDWLKNI